MTLSHERTILRGLRGRLRKAKWLDATDAHISQAAKQRLKDRRYCPSKQRRSRYVRSCCGDSIYSATLSAVILHHVGTVRPKANPPVEVDAQLKPHWKDSESESTAYRDGLLSLFAQTSRHCEPREHTSVAIIRPCKVGQSWRHAIVYKMLWP